MVLGTDTIFTPIAANFAAQYRQIITAVQPVIGKKDAYIAMFDRWKKKDLEDSRYVWLPVLVKDGKITIPWHEKWTLSIFDK